MSSFIPLSITPNPSRQLARLNHLDTQGKRSDLAYFGNIRRDCPINHGIGRKKLLEGGTKGLARDCTEERTRTEVQLAMGYVHEYAGGNLACPLYQKQANSCLAPRAILFLFSPSSSYYLPNVYKNFSKKIINSIQYCSIALLCLLSMFCSACSFRGSLHTDFYKSSENPYANNLKIPVTVAYSPLKDFQAIRGAGDLGDMYSIDVNNGLNAAILVMLKDTFEKVITISEISENEKPLFIVKPNFKSKAISRNRSTGDMDFVAKLFLDFTLYVNNDLVASFSKEELIHYENPDSVTLLNILTGASLYLLSPITIPAIAQVAGEHGVDLAEGKLSTMLNEIKTDVKAEKKKLVSFLSTATTDSLIEVASTVSNAKSKYDNFLDCVVVVRTADGIGSGFLVSRNGKVITNYHVVAGEKTVSIRLRNGLTQLAKVEAIDKACDLALLKMEGDNFPWLVLEGDKMSGTGAEVLAIGTPKGLDWSVSRGIISAIRKGKSGIVVVQTDAAINPGNSGGPLIALESGKVVGINSFGYRKDTTEGLNFAIGANEIKKAFPHELK